MGQVGGGSTAFFGVFDICFLILGYDKAFVQILLCAVKLNW